MQGGSHEGEGVAEFVEVRIQCLDVRLGLLAGWIGVRTRTTEHSFTRLDLWVHGVHLGPRIADRVGGSDEYVTVMDQIAAERLQLVKCPVQLGLESGRAFRGRVEIVDPRQFAVHRSGELRDQPSPVQQPLPDSPDGIGVVGVHHLLEVFIHVRRHPRAGSAASYIISHDRA